jgi:hypothetical protein
MAKLKAATRNKLPSSAFGLTKQRKYPMENRTHQIKAEEFATKEEHAGKLSPAQAERIKRRPSGCWASRLERSWVVDQFEFPSINRDGQPMRTSRPSGPHIPTS